MGYPESSYGDIKDPETGMLIHPLPEWECPLCGAKSVIQRISRLENILKCEGCDWQKDLNTA